MKNLPQFFFPLCLHCLLKIVFGDVHFLGSKIKVKLRGKKG